MTTKHLFNILLALSLFFGFRFSYLQKTENPKTKVRVMELHPKPICYCYTYYDKGLPTSARVEKYTCDGDILKYPQRFEIFLQRVECDSLFIKQ